MEHKQWTPYRINPEVLERITLTVEIDWNGQTEEQEKNFFKLLDEITRRLDYQVQRFYQPNGLLEILEVTLYNGRVYRVQGAELWNHLLAIFIEIEQTQANWIDCDWYSAEDPTLRSHFQRTFHFVVFDQYDMLFKHTLVLTTQTRVPTLDQVFEIQEWTPFEMTYLYKKDQLKALDELFLTQSIKKPKTYFWNLVKKWLNRLHF